MSQRRRALTLEPVEDRCVPSGVRWDHRPPVAFTDYDQHAGPTDGQRLDRRDDGPANRGPGSGSEYVVVVIPRVPAAESVAPRVTLPKLNEVVAAARSAGSELSDARFARPDAVVELPFTAAFAAGRVPLRLQASVSEAPPVAEPVAVAQPAARAPATPRTFAVSTTVPDQTVPANQAQPVAVATTTNFALPTTDPGRGIAPPTASTWVATAEPATDAPTLTTPTPDEIVLPGVVVDPPTVATVVEAAREAVVAVAAPLVPLVGALPVDLVAVERAAADLLAGLTETTESTAPVGRWGWVGLSVLAAGGLIHALRPTTDRRAAAAVGNDSALARWESRHARPVR